MAIYDDSNAFIKYSGSAWYDSTSFSANRIGDSTKTYVNPTNDVTITFYFAGAYLKTYGAGYSGMNTCNKIAIDELEYDMNMWSSITNNAIGISFEKNDIKEGVHKAIISYNNSTRIYFDGIECEELLSEDEYNKRLNNSNNNVLNGNVSLTYQLPMNTTNSILAKSGDDREGLLGMANDPDNYGDLYIVGKDGKSHLAKAGMKSEVIFEGIASSVGQYDLLESIDKYKFLLVVCCVSTSAGDTGEKSNLISVNNIILDKANAYDYGRVVGNYPNLTYGFSKKKLIVNGIAKGNYVSVQATRVIGIY